MDNQLRKYAFIALFLGVVAVVHAAAAPTVANFYDDTYIQEKVLDITSEGFTTAQDLSIFFFI